MNTTVATIFSNPWFQNILSEFLVLAILLGLGWVLYRLMSRGPLLSFFRIRQSKRLFVYLSNLLVQRGGAVGIDGIPRGFEGSAIPTYEALLMPAVQRLFNYVVPGVDSLPGFLKQLLLSDVTVEVLPSPLDVSAIEGEATFIAVGSPGYNQASRYVEDSLHSIARFTDDNRALIVPGAPALNDTRCAFVQRAGNARQQGFYVAGMSSQATTGAVRFLITQWRYLAKKYPGSRPFCVMLRVTSEDGSRYQIIYERE